MRMIRVNANCAKCFSVRLRKIGTSCCWLHGSIDICAMVYSVLSVLCNPLCMLLCYVIGTFGM